jgi:hypothetical protein
MPIISVTMEIEIRNIAAPDQFRQKVSKIQILINNAGKVVCVCNSSYLGGIGRIISNQSQTKAKKKKKT